MAKKDQFKVEQETERLSYQDLILEYSTLASALEYGELTEELEERLIANQKNFEDKLAGINYVIMRNKQVAEGVYKVEAERMAARAKAILKSNEFLKERAKEIVRLFAIDGRKLQTEKVNASLRDEYSVEINQEIYDQTMSTIHNAIWFNDVEENEAITHDMHEHVGLNLSMNLTIEEAAKVVSILRNSGMFPDTENAFKITEKLGSGVRDILKQEHLRDIAKGEIQSDIVDVDELFENSPNDTKFDIPGVGLKVSQSIRLT